MSGASSLDDHSAVTPARGGSDSGAVYVLLSGGDGTFTELALSTPADDSDYLGTSVAGLTSVAGDLTLYRNPSLSTADADALAYDTIGEANIGGAVTIEYNAE